MHQKEPKINIISKKITQNLQLFFDQMANFRSRLNSHYLNLINLNNPIIQLTRVDRPWPIFVMACPPLWSLAMVTTTILEFIAWSLFFLTGAVLMRSAGCIINDIIDRNIDGKVERSNQRPLVIGSVTIRQAVITLLLLLAASGAMLLALPKAAILIGVVAMPLTVLYPFLKRVTYYPQVLLGLVFNLGGPIAWVIFSELISWPVLLLYGAAVCWTIGYDTIYAYQDREDDIKAGLKSTAVLFAERGKEKIWTLYKLASAMIFAAGACQGLDFAFYIIMAIGSYHLYLQTTTIDLEDLKDCGAKFRSNADFGFLVLLAIIVGRI